MSSHVEVRLPAFFLRLFLYSLPSGTVWVGGGYAVEACPCGKVDREHYSS